MIPQAHFPRIARAAFRLRGTAFAGFVVRQSFAHASRLLPVQRVAESPHVLAFRHPVAGFEPVHMLLVPKRAVRAVIDFTDRQREEISREVETLARESLARVGRPDTGFLVVVNGGPRQDLAQVHFHLLTDGYAIADAPAALPPRAWIDVADASCEIHQVRAGDRPLFAGLAHAAEVRDALELERRGYSIVWDARTRDAEVVHLTAGKGARR